MQCSRTAAAVQSLSWRGWDVVRMTAGTSLLSAIEEMMVRLAGPDYKIVFACHSDPLKTEPVHHVPSFETADRR